MPLTRVEANAIMAAVKAALAPYVEQTPGSAATPAQVTSAGAKQPHDPSDPVVKVLPKGWKGEDLRGKRYSQCPPLFLGQLAHMLDAFADKSEGDTDPQKQRYAKWDRENAQKAREWRAKLENKAQPDLPVTIEQLANEGAL